MKYLQKKFNGPRPEKVTGCERCIYSRGPHADWCPEKNRKEKEKTDAPVRL